METKNITTGFTEEGVEKVKEMTKRYGVLKHMMLDAIIHSADEQAPEFKERIEYWQNIRGRNPSVSNKVAVALAQAKSSMTEEDIIELLKTAAITKQAR